MLSTSARPGPCVATWRFLHFAWRKTRRRGCLTGRVLDNLATDVARPLERICTGTIIITNRQATGWSAMVETVALDVLTRPRQSNS